MPDTLTDVPADEICDVIKIPIVEGAARIVCEKQADGKYTVIVEY